MLAAMRFRLFALLLGVVLLAGCGSDSDSSGEKDASGTPPLSQSTPEATPTATATASAAPAGCETGAKASPKKQKAAKPNGDLDPSKTYTAVVKTSCGEFSITLDVKRAPQTTASFAGLAEQHFYDGTTFHRIVPGFVIQGGDPAGDGSGGPGYSVEEAPPKNLQYRVGVVAMAKTGDEAPGTSGSQFFIVTGDGGVSLPPDYALVGELASGTDTVQQIATAPTDPSTEQPIDPIVIESVTIETK
jgi:peptidyl-prolyl cis-trans isomerase B (cyclophilin B)